MASFILGGWWHRSSFCSHVLSELGSPTPLGQLQWEEAVNGVYFSGAGTGHPEQFTWLGRGTLSLLLEHLPLEVLGRVVFKIKVLLGKQPNSHSDLQSTVAHQKCVREELYSHKSHVSLCSQHFSFWTTTEKCLPLNFPWALWWQEQTFYLILFFLFLATYHQYPFKRKWSIIAVGFPSVPQW